jgi:hypothetical protein
MIAERMPERRFLLNLADGPAPPIHVSGNSGRFMRLHPPDEIVRCGESFTAGKNCA